jgi:HAD superfamily hydrolase (TIGR01509 family)
VIRALLFDFDGLVVDTEVPGFESWREVYKEYGVDLALSDWLPVVGSGASTGAHSIFDAVTHLEALARTTVDRESVVERRSRLKAQLCDRAALLPGVGDYLAEARRRGLRTAIVTRAPESWVEHHFARVALAHPWDTVVCGDGRAGTAKSHFYLEALKRLGVASHEALAFEDSPHGVEAAKEAGIRCVAVPNGVTRAASFEEADLVLASLAERSLADVLATLAGDSGRR